MTTVNELEVTFDVELNCKEYAVVQYANSKGFVLTNTINDCIECYSRSEGFFEVYSIDEGISELN